MRKVFNLSLCVAASSVVLTSAPGFISDAQNAEESIVLSVPDSKEISFTSESATLPLIRNLEKLDMISKLPYDWNGNGAGSFPPLLLNNVKEILYRLPKQPELFPTANNSIQIEFDNINGAYLEMEIFIDRVHIFMLGEDKKELELDINPGQYDLLRKIVDQFSA